MFSNLSFREKLAVYILTALALTIVFIFVIYRPQTAKVKELKVTRSTKETEWVELKKKIDRVPGLEKELNDLKTTAIETAGQFTVLPKVEPQTTFEGMFKPILDSNHLATAKFEISKAAPGNVPYYYNTSTIVAYPLLQAADINGEIAKEATLKVMYEAAIKAKPVQQVLATTIDLTFRGKKVDIMNFLDEIAELGNKDTANPEEGKLDGTIIINTFSFVDFTFGAASEKMWEKGYSEASANITIYTVEPPHFNE